MSDSIDGLTADKLVAIYLKIRSKIKEHEEEIDRFKEQMQMVSNKMLSGSIKRQFVNLDCAVGVSVRIAL